MTSTRAWYRAHWLLAVAAAITSLGVAVSCASTSCAGIAVDGPHRASTDEAFDAFLVGHRDPAGQPFDRGDFVRTPAQGSTGAPDDRVQFELVDTGPGDLPARELLVGVEPDGSWRVRGGCV